MPRADGRRCQTGGYPMMKNVDWKALLIAPIAFPALCSLLIVLPTPGSNPLSAFVLLFAIGCVVSYGATLALLLPVLILFSLDTTRLTAARAVALGAALGALLYLPLGWILWRASGPDSGPPEDAFTDYLVRSITDPLVLMMPLGGLITTLLYQALAAHRARQERG